MKLTGRILSAALAALMTAGLATTAFAGRPNRSYSGVTAVPAAQAQVPAPVEDVTFTSDAQSFTGNTKKVTFKVSRSAESYTSGAWGFVYRVGGAGNANISVEVPDNLREYTFSLDLTATTAVTLVGITDGVGESAVTTALGKTITVEKFYTLSYNANGGTGTVSDQAGTKATVVDGSGISRQGFTFKGWNTLANGSGTNYVIGREYTLGADVTLYAQWEAIPVDYTVTYNLNDGTGTVVSEQTGTKVTLAGVAALTRDGFTFKGWNTLANGSGTAYTVGKEYTLTADITLYAQWAKQPEFTVSDASVIIGDSIDLSSLVKGLSPANSKLTFYSNILCREADALTAAKVAPAVETSYWVKAEHPDHADVVSKAQMIKITVDAAPSLEVVGTQSGKVTADAGESIDLTKFARSVDGAVISFYEGDRTTKISNPSSYKAKKSVKIYVQAVYTPTGLSPLARSTPVSSAFMSFDLSVMSAAPEITVTSGVVGKGDTIDLLDYVTSNPDNAELYFYRSKTGANQVSGSTVTHTATQSYDYYVKAIKDGIPSEAGTAAEPLTKKITLNVIEKPSLTVVTKSIKKGASVDLATLITNVNFRTTTGITYYSDAQCENLLSTSLVTPSATGTYTYYAKAVNLSHANIFTITPLTITVTATTSATSAPGKGPESSGDSLTEQAAKTAYNNLYLNVLEAKSGSTVTYNGSEYNEIPFWVVDALAGKDIKLQLTYKDAAGASRTATIDCKRVPKTAKNRIFWPAKDFATLYA